MLNKKNYKYSSKEINSTHNDYESSEYGQEKLKTRSELNLSNYEQDHDSKQKSALIDRVRKLRDLKSNPETPLNPVQQLQLEVAERLLGPQAVEAVFNSKKVLNEDTNPSEDKHLNPEYSKYDLDMRDNRRKSKINRVKDVERGRGIMGEEIIKISGSQDKFDKLSYDKGSALDSFTFYRNSRIIEIQSALKEWEVALKKYEKMSKGCEDQIAELNKKKDSIKDGLNIFAKKGNQAQRDVLQIQIDNLSSNLKSSNENISSANTRINTLTAENIQLTKEIADFKKELDKKYTL